MFEQKPSKGLHLFAGVNICAQPDMADGSRPLGSNITEKVRHCKQSQASSVQS